ARVHFDFRRQTRLRERLFQNVLIIGSPRIIVCRNRNEELRLALRRLQMRTIRHISHESAAMEGSDCSDAARYGGGGTKRDWAAHAVALRAHLPIPGNRWLLVQPSDERLRISHVRRLVQTLGQWPHLVDWCRAAGWRGRSFLDTVERIHYEHRIPRFGESFAYLPERRPQPEDIRPHENTWGCAARGM